MAWRIATTAASVAAACFFGLPCTNAAPPVIIGGTLSLSGLGPVDGAAVLNASSQFAAWVNGGGGVDLGPAGGGRATLMLEFIDDGGTAAGVRAGYAALLARGVSLFLGPPSPFDTVALDTLAAAGRPTAIILPAASG